MPQCQDCRHHVNGKCKAHPPSITGYDNKSEFPSVDPTQEPCNEFKAQEE